MAKPSTQRYKECMKGVVLELCGWSEPDGNEPWFAHGKALEPYARGAYEWKTGQETDPNWLLIHPEHDWLSASPDGIWIPDRNGMIEIKGRAKLSTYLEKVQKEEQTGKIEAAYRPQVQCQMLVSGLDEIDFVNYYRDETARVQKMHITTVERDQAYIDRMEERAMEFMLECYRRAEG